MGDTKILQAIIDGQVLIRKEIKDVKKEVGKVEKNLTARIDKIGLQLARLEDDAPTIEEFDELGKRVTVLEQASPN
ncbi:hypothetical protein KKB40_00545 [Patescibacteria group bacterium]|nr:hypothetical protein [Patescibacteria group bacterium]